MARVSYIRPISRVGMRVINQTHPQHAAALSGIPAGHGWYHLGAQPIPLPLAQQFYGPAVCLGPTINGVESQIDCSDPNCTYGDCGSTNAPATSDLCLGPTINGVESPIDCSDPQCTYGDCISGSTTPTTPRPPGSPTSTVSSTPTQPPAGVPTGATLTYQAQLNVHWFASDTIGSFLSQLPGMLSPQGIQVTNSNYSSTITTFTITLQLHITSAGFAQPNDVRSIIDGAIYQQRGEMPMSSTISMTGAGGGGPSPPGTIGAFLEQNMTTLLFALGAIVILPAVIKKL